MQLSSSRQILALLGISTLFLFEYFTLNMLNVIEPLLAQEFNSNNAAMGWLGSAYFYAMVILLIPAGYIIDKYDLKKVIVLSAVSGVIGTFLLSIAQSYTHLIVSRMIVGICLGPFALVSCIKYISRISPKDKVGVYVSIILIIGILGGALSQNTFSALINNIGWRNALMVIGLCGVVITIILWLTTYIFRVSAPCEKNKDASFIIAINNFMFKSHRSMNIKIGIIASVLNLPVFILGALFGVTFLEQVYGFSELISSSVTVNLFWGMLLGCISFGMLSARGYKETNLLTIGMILASISLSLLIFIQTHNILLVKIIFFTIGLGAGSHVVSFSLIQKISDYRELGLAEGFHSASIFLGGAIAQPMFGKILDQVSNHMFMASISATANAKLPYQFGLLLLTVLLLLGLYCNKAPQRTKGSALNDVAAKTG